MAELYQELKTNRGTMRGMLHKPETDRCPLVVMLHGFTGNRQEHSFLFVQFSRYLCTRGVASLRFDFLGSGESDKDFQDMTFAKEVEEGTWIIDYAKSLGFASEIILLGLSMGGAAATHVAAKCADDISKLILWAPALNMPLYARGFKTQLQNGEVNYDAGGIELGKALVEELSVMDMAQGIDTFQKPVMIFHGTNDKSVPIEFSRNYLDIYKNAFLTVMEGGDHTFNNVEMRKDLFAKNLDFIRK